MLILPYHSCWNNLENSFPDSSKTFTLKDILVHQKFFPKCFPIVPSQLCKNKVGLFAPYCSKVILPSYRTRNILLWFDCKSPTFGPSYRTRNILPWFDCKSPNFGPSYRTRNILPWFDCKSPNFGPSYSTRNLFTNINTLYTKALLLVPATLLNDKVDDKATIIK